MNERADTFDPTNATMDMSSQEIFQMDNPLTNDDEEEQNLTLNASPFHRRSSDLLFIGRSNVPLDAARAESHKRDA